MRRQKKKLQLPIRYCVLLALLTCHCGLPVPFSSNRETKSDENSVQETIPPVETTVAATPTPQGSSPAAANTSPSAPLGSLAPMTEIEQSLVSVAITSSPTLRLVSATAATEYNVEVTGCGSGYTPTWTHLSGSKFLYRGDENCIAKLKSFKFDGIVWEMDPTNHDDFCFTTGTICTYWNPGSTESLRVEVTADLSTDLTAAESITWNITENEISTGETLISVVDINNTASGTDIGTPPSLTLTEVYLASTNAQHAGTFKIKLQCTSAIDNTDGDRDNWTCDSDTMSTFIIKLIDDTYTATLDQTQADTEMGSGTTAISNASSHIKDISEDADIPNGGIVIDLQGPDDIYGNKEMILIISQNTDHKYWSLTALQP